MSNRTNSRVAGGVSASNSKANQSEYYTLDELVVNLIFIREVNFEGSKQPPQKPSLCMITQVLSNNLIKYINLDKPNNLVEREGIYQDSFTNFTNIVYRSGGLLFKLKKPSESNLKRGLIIKKQLKDNLQQELLIERPTIKKNNKKGTFIFIPNQNGNSGNVGQIIGTKQNKNIVTIIFRNVPIIDKTLTNNI